jgi:hypothetical protein
MTCNENDYNVFEENQIQLDHELESDEAAQMAEIQIEVSDEIQLEEDK